MEKLVKGLGMAVLISSAVFIAAMIGGTLLYFIWPVAIPAAFPGIVASGLVSARLSWWASVCLAWVFGILVKATSSNSSK